MLLHGGQAGTPDELTAALGVTRRTLFRDLSVLKDAGIPYYFEPGKGYRIGQSYFLPAINLSVIETLGLLVLGKTAAAQRHRPMMTAALSAINKLILAIPQPLRVACGDLMSNVTVHPGGQLESDREGGSYTLIQRCIDERRSCDISYAGPQADPVQLRMCPYALHFAARAWYVFGHSSAHGSVRMFKLSRITAIAETNQRFKRPRHFSAEKFLGNAWQMIPEGKLERIERHFTPRVATNVCEVRWHPSQQVRRLDDGGCIATFEIDGLNEISWWVCGYADQVRVLSPPELVERVRDMHARAADGYRTPRTDSKK